MRSVSARSATTRRLVPSEAFAASGVEPRGELWAAMLDTKAGWDELIRRHAPERQGAGVGARQPAVPEHHRPVRAQPRLPGDGSAPRAARLGAVRPDHRRHATVAERARRARRAGPDEGVLRLAAAQVAHAAVPLAAVHGCLEALLPSRRPGARLAVPPGHRRVLHPVPGDGARLRRPRPRGRAAARRSAHDVRRRVDARGGARPTRRRTWRARCVGATCTSARSSPTACCRRHHLEGVGDERPQARRARRRHRRRRVATELDAEPDVVGDVLPRSCDAVPRHGDGRHRESERRAELRAGAAARVDPAARRATSTTSATCSRSPSTSTDELPIWQCTDLPQRRRSSASPCAPPPTRSARSGAGARGCTTARSRRSSHEGAAGDLAVVFDDKRRFVAIGLWDPDVTDPGQGAAHRLAGRRSTAAGGAQRSPPRSSRRAIARRRRVDDRVPLRARRERRPARAGRRPLRHDARRQAVQRGVVPAPGVASSTRSVELLAPERVSCCGSARSVAAGDTFGLADGDTLLGRRPTARCCSASAG